MPADDRELRALAEAVADGEEIDWDVAASRLAGAGRLVRQLRLIAAASPLPGRAAARERAGRRVPAWVPVLAALASLKIVLLAALALLLPLRTPAYPVAQVYVLGLTVAVFGSAGWLLWYGGRRDTRAVYLGTFFLLVADAFTGEPVRLLLGGVGGALAGVARVVAFLPDDAFLAAVFGLFTCEFPRTTTIGRRQRAIVVLARLALAGGVLLFVVNLLRLLPGLGAASWSTPLDRRALGQHYWDVLFILGLPFLPLSLWKTRFAPAEERARVRFLAAGLAVGVAPMIASGIAGLAGAAVRQWMFVAHRWLVGTVVYACLLSIPVTAAYAVLVHRVLDVRVIVRKALQYLLARYTLIAMTLAPFAGLAVYAWTHREESLARLLTGWAPILLAATTAAGLVLAALRVRLMAGVDRLFFRERRDTRRSVATFADASRDAGSVRQLGMLLRDQVDEALHPEPIALLVRQVDADSFAPLVGWVPPLACDSAIVAVLAGKPEPLDVDLENRASLSRLLPEPDRQWLADTGCRLVVPLLAADRSVFGLLALGEKRSQLPYTEEDRLFLSALAGSAAIVIENRLMRITGEAPRSGEGLESPAWDEPGAECTLCGAVLDETTGPCACGGPLVTAALPRLLLGKFRIEQRVGKGGMGVVYRAADLALGRLVAAKTLPRVSPESSVRLRREARAMASVVHPTLALVYGIETWRGVPVLIVEYLHGGTLRDRLRRGPMAPRDVVDLGVVLADALHHVHRVGVLHRDVKPSNIGFQADGTPKLLDFGLARMLDETGLDEGRAPFEPVVGTPLYLAPEAILDRAVGPSLDLWGLALALYEALAGDNPFRARSTGATFDNIVSLPVPDLRMTRPDCPPPLAEFLSLALHRDVRVRPATAAAFGNGLREIRSQF